MAIGIIPNKQDVDYMAGGICRDINAAMGRVRDFKAWLDGKPDQDLEALGYTPGEVAVLKSAFADMEQFRALYSGTEALAAVKDFRAFAKQLYGFGI